MLGLGSHLETAGHLPDRHAVLRLVEFRDQLVEQLADPLVRLFERACELRQGQRLLGDINDGLENRLQLDVFHRSRLCFLGLLWQQLIERGGRLCRLYLQFVHASLNVVLLNRCDGLVRCEHDIEAGMALQRNLPE